jgi:peptidoglycan/LPS O-acetylase OafA/YrhL
VLAKLKPYAKAIVAVLVAGVVALQAALTDGTVTDDEWKAIAAAVVTAVLVYFVPNKPEAPAE